MRQVLQNLRSGETSIHETPVPVPGPGQVLVRVRASAVSAGTERMLVGFAQAGLLEKARSRPDLVRRLLDKARRDGPLEALQGALQRMEEPMPLGYSCAGVVEEVGDGVALRKGERVACAGAGYANHAEFVAVPENLCARLPAGSAVTDEEACFATLGAIALHGLRLGNPVLGESVAVVGLGLLGQLAVQFARASGARVFGVDLLPERTALACRLGAEAAALRPEAESVGMAFTAGKGFDLVLLTADSPGDDAIRLAGTLARDRGVVVALGAVGLQVPRELFFRKELTLRVSRSYGPGRYDPLYEEGGVDYPYGYVRWTEGRNLEEVLRLLGTGALQVRPLITHRVPLAQAPSVYKLIAQGGGASLGVVLTYPENAPRQHAVALRPRTPVEARGSGISVLGAGLYARTVLLPILRDSGAALRVIAAPSGAHAQDAGKRFGFAKASSRSEDALENPQTDAVVILTRHHLHAGQVCAALKAGKHVFVEKPLCLTLEELRQVGTTLHENPQLRLTLGFNRRFAPFTLRLRERFSALKGPRAVSIRVNAGELPSGHWLSDPAQGGGRLFGEGCHFVDWANAVVGAKPLAVACTALATAPGEGDWSLRVRYDDGSTADILYTSRGAARLGKERYEVHCAGTSAVLEDFRTLRVLGPRPCRERAWLRGDKGHRALWTEFLRATKEGLDPTPWSGVEAGMLCLFAARKSMAERREVLLSEF